jgi:small subunit ribosomal protein S16
VLVIRLRRAGKKNKPFYRLVVSEQTRQPRSKVTDQVGYYDPKRNPEVLKVDIERVDAWIKKGATPSATVRHLIDRARSVAVQA